MLSSSRQATLSDQHAVAETAFLIERGVRLRSLLQQCRLTTQNIEQKLGVLMVPIPAKSIATREQYLGTEVIIPVKSQSELLGMRHEIPKQFKEEAKEAASRAPDPEALMLEAKEAKDAVQFLKSLPSMGLLAALCSFSLPHEAHLPHSSTFEGLDALVAWFDQSLVRLSNQELVPVPSSLSARRDLGLVSRQEAARHSRSRPIIMAGPGAAGASSGASAASGTTSSSSSSSSSSVTPSAGLPWPWEEAKPCLEARQWLSLFVRAHPAFSATLNGSSDWVCTQFRKLTPVQQAFLHTSPERSWKWFLKANSPETPGLSASAAGASPLPLRRLLAGLTREQAILLLSLTESQDQVLREQVPLPLFDLYNLNALCALAVWLDRTSIGSTPTRIGLGLRYLEPLLPLWRDRMAQATSFPLLDVDLPFASPLGLSHVWEWAHRRADLCQLFGFCSIEADFWDTHLFARHVVVSGTKNLLQQHRWLSVFVCCHWDSYEVLWTQVEKNATLERKVVNFRLSLLETLKTAPPESFSHPVSFAQYTEWPAALFWRLSGRLQVISGFLADWATAHRSKTGERALGEVKRETKQESNKQEETQITAIGPKAQARDETSALVATTNNTNNTNNNTTLPPQCSQDVVYISFFVLLALLILFAIITVIYVALSPQNRKFVQTVPDDTTAPGVPPRVESVSEDEAAATAVKALDQIDIEYPSIETA